MYRPPSICSGDRAESEAHPSVGTLNIPLSPDTGRTPHALIERPFEAEPARPDRLPDLQSTSGRCCARAPDAQTIIHATTRGRRYQSRIGVSFQFPFPVSFQLPVPASLANPLWGSWHWSLVTIFSAQSARFHQRAPPPQLPQRGLPFVEQVTAATVAERANHRVLDPGVLDLELRDQPFDPLPLQAQVPARRTAATDDR